MTHDKMLFLMHGSLQNFNINFIFNFLTKNQFFNFKLKTWIILMMLKGNK